MKIDQPVSDLPEKLKRGRIAALEFMPVLQKKLTGADGHVHAGTILAAAAWLTGASLYRAFHPKEDAPLGTITTSKEINREWESLMYLFQEYNFKDVRIPPGRLILSALTASDAEKPQADMLEIQREFQDLYRQIMKKHGFDDLDGARAGVVLCSLLFQQHGVTLKDINLNVAAGIIAQGILEGAKTAPPPLKR